MSIADNIREVRGVIAAACQRANRNPDEVTLVAISKTHPAEAVLEVIRAGLQHFGENRVEESEIKIPLVNTQAKVPVTWHMVGHIQSRKAKDVLPLFQRVHSVDNVKLATKLSSLSLERGSKLDVLLEVNVSGEAAKYGLQASGWENDPQVRRQLWDDIREILALPGLRVQGLMTMAPIVEQAEMTRPVFASLAALRTALNESLHCQLPDLSMGMTDDYPVAIEEGATIIRIGRAIFGERQKSEETSP
jgi:PLP dependent protein